MVRKEARFYEKINDSVRCLVCERRCLIYPGKRGICWNYFNDNGKLFHIGYGKISALESRPIEIKPLFHYWPNSTALTYSTWGCNFYCPWCQNYHLSFTHPTDEEFIIEPEKIVEMALKYGDDGLSASFNEPAVNLDYIIDASELAKNKGLYSMIVTNMYFTKNSLKALIEVGVDGFSVDIKGCNKMRVLTGIDHTTIFRNAAYAINAGAHVEMIYLVVTNTNDFEECFEWIINNHLKYLGSKVPLHINKYYPAYKWSEPPTSINTLLKIREYAKKEGIEFVYVGNVHSTELESTYCPQCKKLLIMRSYYRAHEFKLDYIDGKYRCPGCGYEIPIKGKYIKKEYMLH